MHVSCWWPSASSLPKASTSLKNPTRSPGAASPGSPAGIVINAFTAWLFLKDKEKDLNVKGAYLHMAADTLVSVGVLISGIVISFTGWYIIDPIIGMVIAVVILISTAHLLHDSLRLSLDGVPDRDRQRADPERDPRCGPGIANVHHLHIWAISTTGERPDSPSSPSATRNKFQRSNTESNTCSNTRESPMPPWNSNGRKRRATTRDAILPADIGTGMSFFGRKSEQNIVAVRIISIFTMKSSLNPNI